MKTRYFLFPLIVIAMMLLTVPFFMGMAIQGQFEKNVKLLSQNMKLNVKLVDYRRSWFSSEAVLTTNFPLADKLLDANLASTNDALIIHQHIYHGPVIIHWRPQIGVALALTYITSYLDDAHFVAKTKVKFNKSLSTQFDLANYEYYKNGSLLYSLKGLNGHVDVLTDRFVANIALDKLFADFDTTRVIDHFSTSSQLKKNSDGAWLGTTTYFFKNLIWEQADKRFGFTNFNVSVAGKQSLVNVDYKLIASVKDSSVDNMQYGPQYITMTISNINSAALAALQKNYPLTSISSNEYRTFNENFKHLFSQGATLKIETLGLNTALGKVNVRASLDFPHSPMNTIDELFTKAHGHIDGQFPIALANTLLVDFLRMRQPQSDLSYLQNAVNNYLISWENAGWLKAIGNEYAVDVTWQD